MRHKLLSYLSVIFRGIVDYGKDNQDILFYFSAGLMFLAIFTFVIGTMIDITFGSNGVLNYIYFALGYLALIFFGCSCFVFCLFIFVLAMVVKRDSNIKRGKC